MRFRGFRGSSNNNPFGGDGFRTDWTTAVFKGVVVPLPLLIWGIRDLVTWSVYFPGRFRSFTSYDTSVVLGAVGVKWGIATALFTWHMLANSPRFDEWVGILLAGSCGAAILGLVSVVLGVLV